jgi:hypothetical protein
LPLARGFYLWLASTAIDSRGDNDAAETATTRTRRGTADLRRIRRQQDPETIAVSLPSESPADPLSPANGFGADRISLIRRQKGDPMARSLAERLRAHEQQKARLAEQGKEAIVRAPFRLSAFPPFRLSRRSRPRCDDRTAGRGLPLQ